MSSESFVRIEWVGEKSPLDEDWVWVAKHAGLVTPKQIKVLEAAALDCTHRTTTSERQMVAGNGYGQLAFTDAPELIDKRLGRQGYLWSPRNRWIVAMSHHDADVLLSSPNAHEFVNLDAREQDEPMITVPPVRIQIVQRELFDRYGNLRAA